MKICLYNHARCKILACVITFQIMKFFICQDFSQYDKTYLAPRDNFWQGFRAFNIFQVYYLQAVRRIKIWIFSWISYTVQKNVLFKIRRYMYQRPFQTGKGTWYHPLLKGSRTATYYSRNNQIHVPTSELVFSDIFLVSVKKNIEHIQNVIHVMSPEVGLGLLYLMPLSTIFQYIVAVSFIGGGNWSIWRTHRPPQVIDKLYHIMLYRVHLAWQDSNSQR